jgi:predicted dehydrogenase
MVTGPVLSAGPETTVTGVWSRTAANAMELATTLGVPACDSVTELLDACDAVAIAVAPAAQPAFAIEAARAGKALLLEKPLGDDVEGARTLVEAVHAARVGALVMLSNRFNPAVDEFAAAAATVEPVGGRGCFISGAFLRGPFAYGWRLERGAVLDVGPHLLDLLEAGLGDIIGVEASGDALGWVSMICTHASGATSSASLCCSAATDSRTEIEVFGPSGTALFDGRKIDYTQWASNVRGSLVAAANGASHPANVDRAMRFQELIANIESQLAS